MGSPKPGFQASKHFTCKNEPATARYMPDKLKLEVRYAQISQSTLMLGSLSTVQLCSCELFDIYPVLVSELYIELNKTGTWL